MVIGTVHYKSVGKTTLAVHMAGWLDLYGFKVCVVDADCMGQSSGWLEEAAPQIATRVFRNPLELLREVPKLKTQFHGVIVDGPAGLDETAGAVLTVSDVVIIPCGPTATEIKALKMVADDIREIQAARFKAEGRKDTPFPFVIPIRTNKRWKATRVLVEEAKSLGFQSMPPLVPARTIYAELAGLGDKPGQLLWQIGRSQPVKEAVQDLDNLFQLMFPEVAEEDPTLVQRMMNEPLRRAMTKPEMEELKSEENEQEVVNA